MNTTTEVKDPIVNENTTATDEPTIPQVDLSSLTDDQLEKILAERKKSKESEQKKAEREFKVRKNAFVTETAKDFQSAHQLLIELKKKTIDAALQLYGDMFTVQGKELKAQNNFTFKSDDGRMKIQIERQERFEFTEEATVHIAAIKDIFKAKFSDRNKGLYNFLDRILMKNTKGDYDPKSLIKARTEANALGDVALIAEFDKLMDCQRVVGSAMYCRAYIQDEQSKWQDINVQFSSL